jgi:ankyrin repeat protein
VQVDPIKPVLKAPGTKRLNPKRDELLSNIAFGFNLRRYTEAGNVASVAALVKAGAKIDLETRDSRTALSVAAASGQVETVEELLTQCAYVDYENKLGQTALMARPAQICRKNL